MCSQTKPIMYTFFTRWLGALAVALLINVSSTSVLMASSGGELLRQMSLEQLMEYTVKVPSKLATPLSDVPGSVSLITYDQIQNSSARTIPELLRLIPGVHTRWNPMVQSIEIRSFGSSPFTSKVLLLIDGVPFNSWNKGGFPQHPGFDFFNIDNVKHIEVMRGPASALYGENALNGVINIVTLTGSEFAETNVNVLLGARESRSYQLTHGQDLGENSSIFISSRYEETQLPTEFWREQNSYTEAIDVFVKLVYDQLQLSAYVRKDQLDGYEIPLPFGENQVFASSEVVEQDIMILAGKYTTEDNDGKWSMESNFSYSTRDGSHCGSCHAIGDSTEFSGKTDHGHQLFGNLQFNLSYFEQHQILLGAEYRKLDSGDSIDVVETSEPLHAVQAYDKYSLFVQDKMDLLDSKLEVYAGLRYDASTSPELFGSELVPRLAMVAKPSENVRLRASWGQATRYPSFVELYQNIGFFGPPGAPIVRFKPNEDLEPEKIDSFELGLEYAFKGVANVKHNVFYNEITNPIIAAATLTSGTIGFENHPADATVKGFENEVLFRSDGRWDAFINWSYQSNEQSGVGTDSLGNPLEFTYSPKHKVNMGFNYRHNELANLNVDLVWRDKYYAPRIWNALANQGDPTPFELDDYAYINFKLALMPAWSIFNGERPLTISITGTNLGNDTPRESLTGANGEMIGREFWLEFEYTWD